MDQNHLSFLDYWVIVECAQAALPVPPHPWRVARGILRRVVSSRGSLGHWEVDADCISRRPFI